MIFSANFAKSESNDSEHYFSNNVFEWAYDYMAVHLGVLRPIWGMTKFKHILEMTKSDKAEGFVVYGEDSRTVLKLKTPYYLALKLFARKKDILTLDKKKVDEEYYPLLQYCLDHYDEYVQLDEQQKLEMMRKYLMENI